MKNNVSRFFAFALIAMFLFNGNTAFACTWAAYNNGKAAVVVRTMDWYYDDNMTAQGNGRGINMIAADTPNALTYTTKYASLQMDSFGGLTFDAVNEKGLHASILFLEGAVLPAPVAGLKDVDAVNLLNFIVSNHETVQEAVDAVKNVNIVFGGGFVPIGADGEPLPIPAGVTPFHFAMADVTGDKAVIEFWEGEMKIYHGKEYDAMSNEPNYEIHLALDALGYRSYGGIATVDRRGRAREYMQDMYARDVIESERGLLAMRGLLASVWAGTEQMDPVDKRAYPTIWGALIDQSTLTYYVSRYNTMSMEKYDFTMFDPGKPEIVALRHDSTLFVLPQSPQSAPPEIMWKVMAVLFAACSVIMLAVMLIPKILRKREKGKKK